MASKENTLSFPDLARKVKKFEAFLEKVDPESAAYLMKDIPSTFKLGGCKLTLSIPRGLVSYGYCPKLKYTDGAGFTHQIVNRDGFIDVWVPGQFASTGVVNTEDVMENTGVDAKKETKMKQTKKSKTGKFGRKITKKTNKKKTKKSMTGKFGRKITKKTNKKKTKKSMKKV